MEDGIKCGSDSICYNQSCVSVSDLGLPQCPTGFNGEVCSGNGVRMSVCTGHSIYILSKLKVKLYNAGIK